MYRPPLVWWRKAEHFIVHHSPGLASQQVSGMSVDLGVAQLSIAARGSMRVQEASGMPRGGRTVGGWIADMETG